MQLSQLPTTPPDSKEEDDDDDVEDTELIDAYYEAISHLGESLDFLESALKILPRTRMISVDIRKHNKKVKDFLEEQGYSE